MESKAVKEKRFKILPIEESDILDVFQCALDKWPQCLTMPNLDGVPRDAELVRVFHMPECRGFGFLLAHSTFDSLPLGARPELIDTIVERKTVYL